MRNLKNAFYIENDRTMISLGPLTDKKYCPYNCAFCYVKSGFMKYMKLEIDEIIEFLNNNVDITFTTRTTFNENDLKKLKEITII